jgi:sugar lactone lactonase YvrE
LVDLDGEETTLIPNSELGGYGRIAWSGDGEHLYFSTKSGGIHVYDLESDETTEVPVDLKDTIFQLAAF